MPHSLIIGRTQSGKSSLAKELASELRIAGEEVLAFNPIGERGWTRKDDYGRAGAEWETDDPDEFVNQVIHRIETKPRRRWLCIDEAHEFFTRAGCDDVWMVTRGRHYGLNCIIITQRGALLNTTARSQCYPLYVFQCSLTDAKLLSDECGRRELLEAPSLQLGKFYKVAKDQMSEHVLF